MRDTAGGPLLMKEGKMQIVKCNCLNCKHICAGLQIDLFVQILKCICWSVPGCLGFGGSLVQCW